MKTRNLLSVFQGDAVLERGNLDTENKFKTLKKHEIRNMKSFCAIMSENGVSIRGFDGFFVSYSIPQIGKEFDLLRFGTEYLLNIEIKSELKVAQKEQKILKQMAENYYYLNFLGRPIRLFTYVENDGFYQYSHEERTIEKIPPDIIAGCLENQDAEYSVNPDMEFVPSNYLISPFNSTDKFVNGEYFLTSAQQRIKSEVQEELERTPFMFFCLSANAGTGKTLLLYDIAKTMMNLGKTVMIIHCGMLNDGHTALIEQYKWNIKSIRAIPKSEDAINLFGVDCIFVDEAQRIRIFQLEALTKKAFEMKIPVFFSFDTKQYLRTGETRDLSEYLKGRYPDAITSTKKLTNKIRTNKAMASFITNLMNIGKSNDNLNYDCVTIEYIDNHDDLKRYIDFLETRGWKAITYTTSQHNPDPYDSLAGLCTTTAHAVIGQEFSKVVFVMDNNFSYGEDGKLLVNNSYYSAKGMVYQIVTRVIDDLKIIVTDNPTLYMKLLEIKDLGN